jgi:hypothetical protein
MSTDARSDKQESQGSNNGTSCSAARACMRARQVPRVREGFPGISAAEWLSGKPSASRTLFLPPITSKQDLVTIAPIVFKQCASGFCLIFGLSQGKQICICREVTNMAFLFTQIEQ